MQNTSRIIVYTLLILTVALGVGLLDQRSESQVIRQSHNSSSSVNVADLKATSTDPVAPTRLRIPKIDVSAVVESVGVDTDGNMAAPSDWRDVSWYEPGFSPGEVGNAVFAGHLDWDGNTAVFWDLDELRSGDVVQVEGDGRLLTYVVTSVEVYDYDVVDTSPIFGTAEGSQIKLITCDGEFIDGSDTYEKRLIVTAQLIDF